MTQQPGPSVNVELTTRLAIDAYRKMKLAEVDAEILTEKLRLLVVSGVLDMDEYVRATDAIEKAADECQLYLDASNATVSSASYRQTLRKAIREAGTREKTLS